MKQFREFSSQQQHINEIGPVGATIAGVMGLIGGAMALKKGIEKVKGYRESQAEKKANAERDVYVNIKKWDEEQGKVVTKPVLYAKANSKKARINNDDLEKERKKLQKNEDPKNASKEGERDAKDDADRKERGGIEDVKDAETYFKNNGEAPNGWRDARTPKQKKDGENPILMTKQDYDKEIARRKRVSKKGPTPDERKKQADDEKKVITKADADKKTDQKKDSKGFVKTSTGSRKVYNSRVLKFGEFIKEDVMKDMRKISKSKKDMEIKLDDGTEIPIDPMTAEIFVKYIEGLKSSEQKKVINQIQRTERGFMKVLGKAHGE